MFCSSAKFKIDCKILKLHLKNKASELFNDKFRCSHCLYCGHRLRHIAPSPLCPGMCRRETWLQKRAALCTHIKLYSDLERLEFWCMPKSAPTIPLTHAAVFSLVMFLIFCPCSYQGAKKINYVIRVMLQEVQSSHLVD